MNLTGAIFSGITVSKNTNEERLTGSEKVAVLLNYIGEKRAFEILSKLSDGEVHHIFNALKTAEYVDGQEAKKIMEEFCSFLAEQP